MSLNLQNIYVIIIQFNLELYSNFM